MYLRCPEQIIFVVTYQVCLLKSVSYGRSDIPMRERGAKMAPLTFISPHFTSDNSPGVGEGARFTHSIGLPQNKTSNMQHELKMKQARLYKEGNRAVCFKTIHHLDTKQLGLTHKRKRGRERGACVRVIDAFVWESEASILSLGNQCRGTREQRREPNQPKP